MRLFPLAAALLTPALAAPALNTWTSISVGEAKPLLSFGSAQAQGDKLSVNVLFTQKAATVVSDSLRPPQKP